MFGWFKEGYELYLGCCVLDFTFIGRILIADQNEGYKECGYVMAWYKI